MLFSIIICHNLVVDLKYSKFLRNIVGSNMSKMCN